MSTKSMPNTQLPSPQEDEAIQKAHNALRDLSNYYKLTGSQKYYMVNQIIHKLWEINSTGKAVK